MFGNSGCSSAWPGNDCTFASGWGHWGGTPLCCWHCRRFVMVEEDTGNLEIGEWAGAEEVSLRWSGSGVAGGWQEGEAVVVGGSWGTGPPFQALEEAVNINTGCLSSREESDGSVNTTKTFGTVHNYTHLLWLSQSIVDNYYNMTNVNIVFLGKNQSPTG